MVTVELLTLKTPVGAVTDYTYGLIAQNACTTAVVPISKSFLVATVTE
jgi:hypothetical protein